MALQLTERDRRIFLHVRRYRMTTRKALRRLFWPASEEGMRTRVRDLTGPYLQAHPLFGREKYYQLTPTAARLVGDSAVAEPLGPQARAQRFALLSYCCLGEGTRVRYRAEEFADDFPDLVGDAGDFTKRDYVLEEDADGDRRLVRVLIDYGGDVGTAVRKCRKVLADAAGQSSFRAHYDEGRFVVALLTGEEPKRLALEAALDAEGLSHVLPVRVISNLGALLNQPFSAGTPNDEE